jgi:DNA-directed RNA polymerase subunit H (RpoH/RPB5)
MNFIKVKATCVEMLTQRGYTNIKNIEDVMEAKRNDGEKVCIIFSEVQKVGVKIIMEYLGYMDKNKYRHGIIVYMYTLTPKAKKAIEDPGNKIIELFKSKELMYNVTTHVDVPKHSRLSQHDACTFKETNGVNFPGIRMTDVISRFYAYQKGDVIRIGEDNEYISYCIVR